MTKQAEVMKRYEEFCEQVQALLVNYADAIAPDQDALGGPCPHGYDEDCDCRPPEHLLVTEWIVISNYMDLESEDMTVVAITPSTQRQSHTIGLVKFWERANRWS